jgi:DNA-binding response OmpR family regulator
MSDQGAAEWYATWYRGGRRRTTKIGRYPKLGLRDARALFRERYLPEILDGRDPIGPRAFARSKGLTVKDMFEAYIEQLRLKKKRSAEDINRILLGPNGAIHDIGPGRLARDVEPRHITPHLAKIRGRGAVGQANLVRGYVRAAFQFGLTAPHAYDGAAVGMDWGLKFNPAALVRVDPEAFRARTRTLSREEFAAFWWWLADRSVRNRMGVALQLMMMTGQRPDEVMQLSVMLLSDRRDEIAWEKTKNGHPHFIPLIGQAKALVELLVPNEHGLFFCRPGLKMRRASVSAPRRLVHEYIAETGCKPFTCHDLRRTWKTLAGDAQIHKDVRDLLQNHRRNDVSSRHYDHYDYRREKREGMEAWDSYVIALLADHPRSAVGQQYVFAGFRFDDGSGDLRSGAGRVRLAAAEAQLLSVLLAHRGLAVSREAIIAACFDPAELPTARAIDLRVSRLRALMGSEGQTIIKTCRGLGYCLAVPVATGEGPAEQAHGPDSFPRAA